MLSVCTARPPTAARAGMRACRGPFPRRPASALPDPLSLPIPHAAGPLVLPAAGMAPSDEQLPSYCLPFEEAQPEASVRIMTRRPVAPSEEEQRVNVRSRSAKLRVVEKL